jgi:hypothetical protein
MMCELQREDSASASACCLFRSRWTRCRSSRRPPPVEGGWTLCAPRPQPGSGPTVSGSPAASYAAIWAEAEEAPCSGCVALAGEGLTLTGSVLPVGETRLVRYADVLGVEIVRDPSQRLNSYPTLRIERRDGSPLRVSTIGLGVLGELNQLLATAIANEQPQLIGIVVPLRKRAFADAAELIEKGPPFDLAAIGIERHEVLLSEREAIFLFEGKQIDEAVQQLVRDTHVWQAASAWARVISGPPRLAEQRFGWHSGRRIR